MALTEDQDARKEVDDGKQPPVVQRIEPNLHGLLPLFMCSPGHDSVSSASSPPVSDRHHGRMAKLNLQHAVQGGHLLRCQDGLR